MLNYIVLSDHKFFTFKTKKDKIGWHLVNGFFWQKNKLSVHKTILKQRVIAYIQQVVSTDEQSDNNKYV